MNSGENFAIKSNGKLLTVEARVPIVNTDTIYYNINNFKIDNYRIKFLPENMDAVNLEAWLIDQFLKKAIPVSLRSASSIDFTVTSAAASSAADRFMVVFKTFSALPLTFTAVKAIQKKADINVEWKVENEINLGQYEVEKSTDGSVFSSVGIVKPLNGTSNNYSLLDQHPAAGYNYYRIRSVDFNGKESYSSIVKVLYAKIVSELTVYPNLILNGIINIQFTNQPQGVYGIRLLNNIGQTIVSKLITHIEGSGTEVIKMKSKTAKGIYQLEISKPGMETMVIKLLNQE